MLQIKKELYLIENEYNKKSSHLSLNLDFVIQEFKSCTFFEAENNFMFHLKIYHLSKSSFSYKLKQGYKQEINFCITLDRKE